MYHYEDLKAIGVNLAETSQYIETSKIENLRYFGQARCAEHENFISIGKSKSNTTVLFIRAVVIT
jgi:hypothetical protein